MAHPLFPAHPLSMKSSVLFAGSPRSHWEGLSAEQRREWGGRNLRGLLDLRGAAKTELFRLFPPQATSTAKGKYDEDTENKEIKTKAKGAKYTIALLDYISVLTMTGLRRVQVNSSVVVHRRSPRFTRHAGLMRRV